MMTKESLLENLSIYNDNLSVYYLGSIFITVVSVIFSWWYHNYNINKLEHAAQNVIDNADDAESENRFSECTSQDVGSISEEFDSDVISQMTMARQSLLAEEVAASLTEEQLEEEKEVEKQQLEAIFQLLLNQQDKYQVSSMEELEDQLKLYR